MYIFWNVNEVLEKNRHFYGRERDMTLPFFCVSNFGVGSVTLTQMMCEPRSPNSLLFTS